jgi:hypothetical protein
MSSDKVDDALDVDNQRPTYCYVSTFGESKGVRDPMIYTWREEADEDKRIEGLESALALWFSQLNDKPLAWRRVDDAKFHGSYVYHNSRRFTDLDQLASIANNYGCELFPTSRFCYLGLKTITESNPATGKDVKPSTLAFLQQIKADRSHLLVPTNERLIQYLYYAWEYGNCDGWSYALFVCPVCERNSCALRTADTPLNGPELVFCGLETCALYGPITQERYNVHKARHTPQRFILVPFPTVKTFEELMAAIEKPFDTTKMNMAAPAALSSVHTWMFNALLELPPKIPRLCFETPHYHMAHYEPTDQTSALPDWAFVPADVAFKFMIDEKTPLPYDVEDDGLYPIVQESTELMETTKDYVLDLQSVIQRMDARTIIVKEQLQKPSSGGVSAIALLATLYIQKGCKRNALSDEDSSNDDAENKHYTLNSSVDEDGPTHLEDANFISTALLRFVYQRLCNAVYHAWLNASTEDAPVVCDTDFIHKCLGVTGDISVESIKKSARIQELLQAAGPLYEQELDNRSTCDDATLPDAIPRPSTEQLRYEHNQYGSTTDDVQEQAIQMRLKHTKPWRDYVHKMRSQFHLYSPPPLDTKQQTALLHLYGLDLISQVSLLPLQLSGQVLNDTVVCDLTSQPVREEPGTWHLLSTIDDESYIKAMNAGLMLLRELHGHDVQVLFYRFWLYLVPEPTFVKEIRERAPHDPTTSLDMYDIMSSKTVRELYQCVHATQGATVPYFGGEYTDELMTTHLQHRLTYCQRAATLLQSCDHLSANRLTEEAAYLEGRLEEIQLKEPEPTRPRAYERYNTSVNTTLMQLNINTIEARVTLALIGVWVMGNTALRQLETRHRAAVLRFIVHSDVGYDENKHSDAVAYKRYKDSLRAEDSWPVQVARASKSTLALKEVPSFQDSTINLKRQLGLLDVSDELFYGDAAFEIPGIVLRKLGTEYPLDQWNKFQYLSLAYHITRQRELLGSDARYVGAIQSHILQTMGIPYRSPHVEELIKARQTDGLMSYTLKHELVSQWQAYAEEVPTSWNKRVTMPIKAGKSTGLVLVYENTSSTVAASPKATSSISSAIPDSEPEFKHFAHLIGGATHMLSWSMAILGWYRLHTTENSPVDKEYKALLAGEDDCGTAVRFIFGFDDKRSYHDPLVDSSDSMEAYMGTNWWPSISFIRKAFLDTELKSTTHTRYCCTERTQQEKLQKEVRILVKDEHDVIVKPIPSAPGKLHIRIEQNQDDFDWKLWPLSKPQRITASNKCKQCNRAITTGFKSKDDKEAYICTTCVQKYLIPVYSYCPTHPKLHNEAIRLTSSFRICMHCGLDSGDKAHICPCEYCSRKDTTKNVMCTDCFKSLSVSAPTCEPKHKGCNCVSIITHGSVLQHYMKRVLHESFKRRSSTSLASGASETERGIVTMLRAGQYAAKLQTVCTSSSFFQGFFNYVARADIISYIVGMSSDLMGDLYLDDDIREKLRSQATNYFGFMASVIERGIPFNHASYRTIAFPAGSVGTAFADLAEDFMLKHRLIQQINKSANAKSILRCTAVAALFKGKNHTDMVHFMDRQKGHRVSLLYTLLGMGPIDDYSTCAMRLSRVVSENVLKSALQTLWDALTVHVDSTTNMAQTGVPLNKLSLNRVSHEKVSRQLQKMLEDVSLTQEGRRLIDAELERRGHEGGDSSVVVATPKDVTALLIDYMRAGTSEERQKIEHRAAKMTGFKDDSHEATALSIFTCDTHDLKLLLKQIQNNAFTCGGLTQYAKACVRSRCIHMTNTTSAAVTAPLKVTSGATRSQFKPSMRWKDMFAEYDY